jgi:hypothetical protein
MENGGLQPVGVLIFVHEDVIEPFVQESASSVSSPSR